MKTKHETQIRNEVISLLVGAEGLARALGNPASVRDTRENVRGILSMKLTVSKLLFSRVISALKREGLLGTEKKSGTVFLTPKGLAMLDTQIAESYERWKPCVADILPQIEAEKQAAAMKSAENGLGQLGFWQ
jgi:hypothetical protein